MSLLDAQSGERRLTSGRGIVMPLIAQCRTLYIAQCHFASLLNAQSGERRLISGGHCHSSLIVHCGTLYIAEAMVENQEQFSQYSFHGSEFNHLHLPWPNCWCAFDNDNVDINCDF